MADRFLYDAGSEKVPITLIRRKNARGLRLTAREDRGICLTFPPCCTAPTIRNMLAEKSEWIKDVYRRIQEQRKESAAPLNYIYLRGKRLSVNCEPDKEFRIGPQGEEFLIHGLEKEQVNTALKKHLIYEAEMTLFARVEQLACKHDIRNLRKIRIGDQKTRWGSCSTKGTLSLNWRLVMFPQNLCDYVILHELAHLDEMNHSQDFYECFETLCPDFVELREEFRIFMDQLPAFR